MQRFTSRTAPPALSKETLAASILPDSCRTNESLEIGLRDSLKQLHPFEDSVQRAGAAEALKVLANSRHQLHQALNHLFRYLEEQRGPLSTRRCFVGLARQQAILAHVLTAP